MNDTYSGPERRQYLELAPDDRERLVRIETHVVDNGKIVVDHEERIRTNEVSRTRHFMSISGLWFAFTVAASFLGIHIK
jgi:hypothetical protein|tara:strand:- start:384 stop:620 length:237 start_codon:yes stop_codon:yes gene_type:complete